MRLETVHPRELSASDAALWRAHQTSDPALQSPYLTPDWAKLIGDVREDARVVVIQDGAGFFGAQRLSRFAAMGMGAPIADYQGVVGMRERLRTERGLSPHDVIVVNAGALVDQKDQATLIRAAALVKKERPEVKFLVLGEGPLRPRLEELIRELKLESSVFLWGHRSDVVDCTALGDIFVLSSQAEGIGGALIDAMAVEVPTAATRVGGLSDLYGSSEAPELTPAGDADALAKNILWVLKDPDEARRRVEQGRLTAARFTAKAMADGYEALYKKVSTQ